MCSFGGKPEGWDPVPFRPGRRSEGEDRCRPQRVRILCGAIEPASPFIEGGCAADWTETLESPDSFLECPRCRQRCPEEIVGCARGMLETRTVFVVGCGHRAFTFSRREKEPFFSVDDRPRRKE